MPTKRRASFRRARAPEHKAEREEHILSMAEQRVQRQPYAEIQMSDLARRVGLVKGTLYLYFPTKETLFLRVMRRVFARFFATAAAELESHSPTRDGLCAALLAAIDREPALRSLVSVLHVVLEHNIRDRDVVDFKRFMLEEVTRLGAHIDSRLRWHDGSGARLIVRLHVLVIGLHHVATPSPAVQRALADESLALFKIDFRAHLAALLRLIAQPIEKGDRI